MGRLRGLGSAACAGFGGDAAGDLYGGDDAIIAVEGGG